VSLKFSLILAVFFVRGTLANAQQNTQLQLKIDSTNRTLTVSAQERVTVDPEIAVIHIGFETPLSDAKTAYVTGAATSNAIVGALKQAGIPEGAIRSIDQHLDRDYERQHKFRLAQSWEVKTPPERAAEILDIAVGAGATESGQIEWTVKDVRALESQALERASNRVREDAAILANGMGVKLGAPVYMTNEIAIADFRDRVSGNYAPADQAEFKARAAAPPLAIEPRKVSRTASVYAVFAIE
jgi:uncharacterized protein